MSKVLNVQSGDYTIQVSQDSSVVISGNLVVTGSTISIESQNLSIIDRVIELNQGQTTGNGVNNGTFDNGGEPRSGISIQRGDLPNAQLIWDESVLSRDPITGTNNAGTYVFKDETGTLKAIATNSINTYGGDLSLISVGNGIVTVLGTNNYETNVLDYNRLYKKVQLSTIARINNIAVINTIQPHGLAVNDRIIINSLNDASFNGRYITVTEVTGPNTFTYANSGPNLSTTISTGSIRPDAIINDDIIPNIRSVADYTAAEFENFKPNILQENNTSIQVRDFETSGVSDVLFKLDDVTRAKLSGTGFNVDNINFNGSTISTTNNISSLVIDIVNNGALDVSNSVIRNVSEPFLPQDASTKNYADSNSRVDNVLYVSKDGSDSNDGTTLAKSKLTIKSAIAASTNGTTVFVKSGNYIEDNPILVPEGVTIVGDNLRSVTVRPINQTSDIFWVNNGVYLTHMTFKDHESPSSAVAFPTDGSAGVIHTSPYVQNCTSMTTTGTGMRVDGDHVSGLKSMVVDAYTQYNQGGIGIHMLNGGNTQLVSVFTICCDIGFLCESGGFTSITNSNSSFGNIGIKADGVSPVKYTGKLVSDASGTVFVLNGLTTRPNVGDAVKFENDPEFYTVRSSTPFTSSSVEIQQPNYNNESVQAKNTRQLVLDSKNKVLSDMIDFLNESYPTYDFNQFKATRDGGYIIDAVVDDMILNNNYKTIQAGLAYYRSSADLLRSTQLVETIAAITFIKDSIIGLLSQGLERTRIETNFNIVITIIQNGQSFAPAYSYTSPTAFDQSRVNAKNIIQINRQFLIEEGIAFISLNYPLPFTYDQSACRRDIGLILDAITYDVLYTGNSQTADSADEYYGTGNLKIPLSEKQATIDTFNYIRALCVQCVTNTPTTVLNTSGATQNRTLPPASSATAIIVGDLFNIVTNLIANAYSTILTLDERKVTVATAGTLVSFQQYSLASSSGHTFEWIGAGTNINTALPYLGGVPIQENEVVETNGGKVYFTSTDQRGDFRIGEELVINRNSGTISGRTFSKSLYAIMTPYILAIGE